ncbi:MAG: hypothetical protein ACFFDI_11165 [Promethearchaeota archaeon]
MSYEKILSRFAEGFPILGVYLHDAGRILILAQNDQKGKDVLRKHLSELESGIKEFNLDDEIFGAVIHDTDKLGVHIIIVVGLKDLRAVEKAWNRIRPVLMKELPLEEIISEAAIETMINRIVEKIESDLADMQNYISNLNKNRG